MSVSRALRNQPKVSPGLARRIRQTALRMGYVPDPALSALTAQRNRRRAHADYGTLAVIFNWRNPRAWTGVPGGAKTMRGIELEARTLGYRVEIFCLKDPGMTGRRMSDILYNRGIRGLIMGPNESPGEPIELDWEAFSIVTIEREPLLPNFHHISPNYYSAVVEAWTELLRRGYRRIGFVTANREMRRVEYQWLAAYLLEQTWQPTGGGSIPPLLMKDYSDPGLFTKWLAEHEPDVVMSRGDPEIRSWLQSLNRRVPQDVGFVSLNVSMDDSSGVVQSREKMGRIAVDILHTKLMHFERGPEDALSGTVVENYWQEGVTLRRRPGRRAQAQ